MNWKIVAGIVAVILVVIAVNVTVGYFLLRGAIQSARAGITNSGGIRQTTTGMVTGSSAT